MLQWAVESVLFYAEKLRDDSQNRETESLRDLQGFLGRGGGTLCCHAGLCDSVDAFMRTR